jgi:RNA polymerase sigma-70 factor (ECF subfamily)
MTDEELVKEFRKGNREAFAELVNRYSRPVTMMILRIIRDTEDAKDISQSVFLKAYEGLSGFMMASSFKTWLYRIAMNSVKDHLRRRKSVGQAEFAEEPVDQSASPAEKMETATDLSRLRAAISRLPEKQRLTLQLRIYEEMDYSEIARVLGGTAGAARANFFQAARTLREQLGTQDGST